MAEPIRDDDPHPHQLVGLAPGLRWWQVVLVWVGALTAPAAIWFGGAALIASGLDDTLGPDECEGIGFGCTLSDRDGFWFLAVVLGGPLVAVATALSVLAASAVTARSRSWIGHALVLVLVIVAAHEVPARF